MLDLFLFNDTATTEIYTLSLHDALPICDRLEERAIAEDLALRGGHAAVANGVAAIAHEVLLEMRDVRGDAEQMPERSEEHTSELQSRQYLVCRLLLEKKPFSARNKEAVP